MAIRVREINGKLVALCAAKHESRLGDLYLNDAADHAVREKIFADFMSEGLISSEIQAEMAQKESTDASEH